MSGFLKLARENEDLESMFSKGYHNEFVLLTVIALRARRTESKVAGLSVGQSLIGDYESYGLTEKKYRTAKKNLEKWGLAAFKGTSKGTIATLLNSSIYDINISELGDQLGEQRADKGRTEGGQGATNKNVKNERKKPNPPKSPQGEPDGFAEFWAVYPRKVNRAGAVKAFAKLNAGEQLTDRIVRDVKARKQRPEWTKDGGQFIPHPTTYLNQRRWEDETPRLKVVDPNDMWKSGNWI